MLLRHMTSAAFIFGTEELESAARDPSLEGMDIGRLRLEAEFSYSKRIGKIRRTFGRTAGVLGQGFSAITRAYASTHPPETYQRYPEARNFVDYFLKNWANKPSTPPWAADVASIELALSRARTLHPTAMEREAMVQCPKKPGSSWYCTHPCALLVSCAYDVGPLFEPARSGEEITRRLVHVAVLAARRRRRPRVMEVMPEHLLLMRSSKEWTNLDPMVLPGTDKALVEHLAEQGLLLMCTK